MLDEYVLPNNDKIAYRIIDGEAVIINLKNSELNILNSVATFIWECLNAHAKVKDIIKSLSDEFEVDYETAEKDCIDLIFELIDKEIIILSPQIEES
jgi:hypothetical protein